MAASQAAITSRERLRRISSSFEPSVITISRGSTKDQPDIQHASLDNDSVTQPLLSPFAAQQGPGPPQRQQDPDAEADTLNWKYTIATWASFTVNLLLLIAKVWGFALSMSYSVLASAADSVVDIASQAVLALADWQVGRLDPRYPVGKTRLQTVGVIGCAVIMSIATLAVIQESGKTLYEGIRTGIPPELDMSVLLYIILGAAAGLKVLLYLYCVALQKSSETMMALAEDHRNDILSSLTAILTGAIASWWQKGWWVDPVGGILISAYIIYAWGAICKEQVPFFIRQYGDGLSAYMFTLQVDKMIGMGAPEDFVHNLEQLANTHHEELSLDQIRAYHFGQRFIVEMEVVLPAQMTVRESHDIALILQHKLEALDEVERAFVHVDYRKREEPEHKVERNLLHNPKDLMSPHEAVAESSGSASFAAEQALLAKELNDHLQASNSVSEQTKRAASEALHGDVRDIDKSDSKGSQVTGDDHV